MGNIVARWTGTKIVWLPAVLASLLLLACLLLPVRPVEAVTNLQGDFNGQLGPLALKLHFKRGADDTLSATLDSPNQGALGIPCSDIVIAGNQLSFKVPSVGGAWAGTIEQEGAVLDGQWTQGSTFPIKFNRDTFVAASEPSAVDGYWFGNLQSNNLSLRMQISVRSDAQGRQYCTADSLDQRVLAAQCSDVVFAGREFAFDVPLFQGKWRGKLAADGRSLTGTWTQLGKDLPLDFERRSAPQTPTPPKQPTFDPALAPVTSAAQMEQVLRRDLERALQSGNLAAGTGVGVSIGIVFNGERRVLAVGAAQATSLFEIGSITKTMTGLMLAQMSVQGQAQPGQALRELLPAGTVTQPAGEEITLLDLATHRSGLPRMPDNFAPKDPANPYADYGVTNLYQFLSSHGVQRPAQPEFAYSNLGFGLLGQALASRAGMDYPKLLERLVLAPLCMRDTTITLDERLRTRFIQGHSRARTPAHAWDLAALAGAGAVRSTADDMLTYLAAQLTPDKTCASKAASARTLPAAIRQTHQLQAKSTQESSIGFAWMFNPTSGNYWHNGATGGYSSFALFNPKGNYAAVVLTNLAPGTDGSLADSLGAHLSQRFAGKPALSLD